MDPEEVKRRIEAARTLRGISQVQMDQLGHAEGLDKQELGRLERGRLPMSNVRCDVLCRVLKVPRRWFEDDDLDVVVGLKDQATQDAAAALRMLLGDLPGWPPEEGLPPGGSARPG